MDRPRALRLAWLPVLATALVALGPGLTRAAPSPATAPAGEATAAREEAARRHNEAARAHFAAGRFAAAYEDLQAAYRLVENDALLINLAVAAYKSGRLADAHDWARFLLGRKPAADVQKEATRLRGVVEAALQEKQGGLEVAGLPPGAEWLVDGQPAPSLRASPPILWLVPGPHRLVVRAADYAELELAVTVVQGPPRPLALRLVPVVRPALLTVTGQPEGAEVLVDGRPVGRLPLRRLELPPGEHALTVRHPDCLHQEHTLQLTAAVETFADVRLQPVSGAPFPAFGAPAGAAGDAATTLVEPAKAPANLHPWGFVTAGIGAAAVIGGGVLHHFALGDARAANDVVADPEPDRARYDDLWGRARLRMRAAYGLYGAGGALVLSGILMEALNPAGWLGKRRSAATAGPLRFEFGPAGVALTFDASF